MNEFILVKFKITGTRPLLTHNPESMKDGNSDTPSKKKKYLPTEEAEKGVYYNEKRNYCLVSSAFRTALLSGLKNKKIGKTAAKSIYQAAVFNIDDLSVLIDPKTEKPLKKYIIDSRRVMLGKKGIIRHRPRFEKWGCFIHFHMDPEVLDKKTLEESLNEAGRIIGVGDYRIERGGPFGSFTAKLCK